MSAATGWPWHVLDDMTFPRLRALQAAWSRVPPMAITLARIGHWLGLSPRQASPVARTAAEAISEAAQFGLPVQQGRPDDPMLALCGL